MATMQAPRPSDVAALSDKDKAVLDETLNHAKSVLSKNGDNAKLIEKVTVGGAVMNAYRFMISVRKTHDFAGKFTVKPSAIIEQDRLGEFVHQGNRYPHPPPNAESMYYGSSGAVVYGDFVLEGKANNIDILHGWLLAWSVLDNEHHVYVEAGPLEKIMKLDMEEVQSKLRKSGTTSYYMDRMTGAEASATITPYGNTAALGSVFGVNRLLRSN